MWRGGDGYPVRVLIVFGCRSWGAATWVINPLDGVLLRPHTDLARLYGCCRRDGLGGPNLLCARCGGEAGVEISDCWTEYDVRLLGSAVVPEPGGSGASPGEGR